jgi:hypothetical protein
MQYAVPQFTDVEDRLIGPLTLKQFLLLLATAGVIMFFWSLLGIGIIFFLFAIPIGLIGSAITFAKFNGRQFFSYLGPFISYLTAPKAMIFKREMVAFTLAKKSDDKRDKEQAQREKLKPEEAESRLKKLAYLLDQKVSEEGELLGQDKA